MVILSQVKLGKFNASPLLDLVNCHKSCTRHRGRWPSSDGGCNGCDANLIAHDHHQGNITLSDIVSLREYVNPLDYITHNTHHHPQPRKIRRFARGYVGHREVLGPNHKNLSIT